MAAGAGPSGASQGRSRAAKSQLAAACAHLARRRCFSALLRLLLLRRDYAPAAACCVQLFLGAGDAAAAKAHLANAALHCDDALAARLQGKRPATGPARAQQPPAPPPPPAPAAPPLDLPAPLAGWALAPAPRLRQLKQDAELQAEVVAELLGPPPAPTGLSQLLPSALVAAASSGAAATNPPPEPPGDAAAAFAPAAGDAPAQLAPCDVSLFPSAGPGAAPSDDDHRRRCRVAELLLVRSAACFPLAFRVLSQFELPAEATYAAAAAQLARRGDAAAALQLFRDIGGALSAEERDAVVLAAVRAAERAAEAGAGSAKAPAKLAAALGVPANRVRAAVEGGRVQEALAAAAEAEAAAGGAAEGEVAGLFALILEAVAAKGAAATRGERAVGEEARRQLARLATAAAEEGAAEPPPANY